MNGGVLLARRGRPRAHPAAPGDAATSTSHRDDLDEALALRARGAWRARRPLSIGLVGNAADVLPELVRRGVVPDLLTDQTCAHDPLNGYVPNGMTLRGGAARCARTIRRATCARLDRADGRARARDARPAEARRGHLRLRQQHPRRRRRRPGVEDAFDFPGFVPAYIRPLFCEGKGPFRWAALSGDPADICAHRRGRAAHVPGGRARSPAGSAWRASASQFQGLPARICWLGYGERAKSGLVFNDLVRTGEVKAPDRHRPRPPRRGLGRLAQPRDRGDEGRLRRHRRLADPQRAPQRGRGRDLGLRPPRRRRRHRLLASTPAWWSSPTARTAAAARLERVLTTDPGMGVMRHADAGYPRAIEVARERGVHTAARSIAANERPAFDRGRRAVDERLAQRTRQSGPPSCSPARPGAGKTTLLQRRGRRLARRGLGARLPRPPGRGLVARSASCTPRWPRCPRAWTGARPPAPAMRTSSRAGRGREARARCRRCSRPGPR